MPWDPQRRQRLTVCVTRKPLLRGLLGLEQTLRAVANTLGTVAFLTHVLQLTAQTGKRLRVTSLHPGDVAPQLEGPQRDGTAQTEHEGGGGPAQGPWQVG